MACALSEVKKSGKRAGMRVQVCVEATPKFHNITRAHTNLDDARTHLDRRRWAVSEVGEEAAHAAAAAADDDDGE